MIESAFPFFQPDEAHLLSMLEQKLCEIGPDFAGELRRFQDAKSSLQKNLKKGSQVSADEYLSASEHLFASKLLYIAWLGASWNLDCFRSPVCKLRLQADYEELHGEPFFHTIPQIQSAENLVAGYTQLLPRDCQKYIGKISGYYAYLETVGFKLAHFWGFQWGNAFFPKVVPGYAADSVFTSKYKRRLEDDLALILFSDEI